ncbi:response regulator [Pseudomonas fluorescens]|nr:response regulator [Pseudomonas fluorescens]TKK02085.1 response regulator [Pseudomonas fluorescens]
MKILIIDDDKKRRDRLKSYIDTQKIHEINEITLAGSIDESKTYLRSIYYDILILDVVLPKRINDTASSANGLSLLDQITRSPYLKKPGVIIGITAYLNDLENYKKEFEKKCSVVFEAASNQDAWKKSISDLIMYNLESKISRSVQNIQTTVLTVHGIQTFGDWQNRLRALVCRKTDEINFSNYKYGYFSAFSFLVPLLRKREVARLATHLKAFFLETQSKKVVIFCHSFGTYLVAEAMSEIMEHTLKIDKIILVLSGSVLQSRHKFGYLKIHPNLTVINECGNRDLPVCGACAFVPGVGMAGRTGFHGMNDKHLTNRFHVGGHSLYFKDDTFMIQNWLPVVFDEDYKIKNIDQRTHSFINDAIFEKTVEVLGRVKPAIYLIILGALIWLIST